MSVFDQLGAGRDAVRLWFTPARVQEEGETPDYRFSLANERTFLAWIRTALALIGGGFAVDQFLTDHLTHWARVVLALVLLAGGVACTLRAVNHWVRCERAMRRGANLPVSRFPAVLALLVAVIALAMVAVVLFGWAG
ncbi:YidH family protein [Streptomyces sp. NPDC049040]|uniref:YidH family protein n=1 Tax=Streptomyces sp. NPDC049040 TaxID=3365593 RepID=UPI003712B62E